MSIWSLIWLPHPVEGASERFRAILLTKLTNLTSPIPRACYLTCILRIEKLKYEIFLAYHGYSSWSFT